jgi:hypothetical protein
MIRRRRRSSHDSRIKGHSYPQAWYENAIGAILAQIGRVDDTTITEPRQKRRHYEPMVPMGLFGESVYIGRWHAILRDTI